MQNSFKTIGAYSESTNLIFKALKKLFLSWHCPFNKTNGNSGSGLKNTLSMISGSFRPVTEK